MERAEISAHQLRVFQFVSQTQRWVTSEEIATHAKVAPRTARAHAKLLVFPGHRYRLAPQAGKRNKAYLLRLQQAEEVFS
jgi:hypothetical protein